MRKPLNYEMKGAQMTKFPKIKPLRTEADYQDALKLLGAFFDSNPDNAAQEEADYFEVLADLVNIYESVHYPIEPPEESYRDWLEEEVRQSRLSSTLSNEEAMNRLDAIRARLMEQVKNAD